MDLWLAALGGLIGYLIIGGLFVKLFYISYLKQQGLPTTTPVIMLPILFWLPLLFITAILWFCLWSFTPGK